MALASATKKKYTDDIDVRVAIDRETGDYESFRRWTVVPDEEHEEPAHQMLSLDGGAGPRQGRRQARRRDRGAARAVEFGRIGAQAAKQVILQKIRDAEREQILNDFLERGDDAASPARSSASSAATRSSNPGRIEALLPRDQLIPKENLRVGDRVRAYVTKIDRAGARPAADPVAHRAANSS